ncbi:ScbA/BarX family gamma-butyrolactone biosynthesis protein [Streptomyces sp. NPDC102383]|uniref:ScbA/BarX family gamma-butyrolactone biosynthesis protein n=1 Tax=Streptomyces sp. NPDC102383 TaxID=3366165 RepID=UPI00382BC804
MPLAHRSSASDTFVHSCQQTGTDRFLVSARLPHDHPFFAPVRTDRIDPLLVSEAFRQAGLVVMHSGYGAPMDHTFLISSLQFDCSMDELETRDSATELALEVDASRTSAREDRTGKKHLELTAWLGEWPVARGVIRTRVISPQIYARLRGCRTEPRLCTPLSHRLAPGTVGRSDLADVLLAPGPREDTWQLSIDTSHPTLFQSPKDHVPGMLLLEAGRQAAQAIQRPGLFVPAMADATFHGYTEIDLPCWIRAQVVPSTTPSRTAVRVEGVQNDTPVFTATYSG